MFIDAMWRGMGSDQRGCVNKWGRDQLSSARSLAGRIAGMSSDKNICLASIRCSHSDQNKLVRDNYLL